MVDNKDEIKLNTPTNTLSEYTSDENIPIKDTETVTKNQESDNNEVHKLTHQVTNKKKWGEYLLEFFMLFLAVFLGFVAENVRENGVEKRNAMENLEGYRNDLIRNQKTIYAYDSIYLKLIPVYDSLTNIFFTRRENLELLVLARLLNTGKRNILTQISIPTYIQLLNSGSLKNIHQVAIRDSMAVYFDKVNNQRDYDLRFIQLKTAMTPELLKIEDLHSLARIDSNDPENLNLIPDLQAYDTLTSEQRRLIINYYRQCLIQVRINHRNLKSILNTNKDLVSLIDKEIEK